MPDYSGAYTFTPNIAGAIQDFGQGIQRIDAQKKEEALRADQQAFNFQQALDDKYNLATGTPYDNVINQSVSSAHEALMKLYKTTPNPTQMQRWTAVSPFVSGLPQRAAQAQLARKQYDAQYEDYIKNNPDLDPNKVHNAGLRAIYYNPDGSLKSDFDPNEGLSLFDNLGDHRIRKNYINPTKAQAAAQDLLTKSYPSGESRVLQQGTAGVNGIYDLPSMTSYEEYKNRQIGIKAEEIKAGDNNFKALPLEDTRQLFSTPALATQVELQKDQLANTKGFKDLTSDQQYQVAAHRYLDTHGVKTGRKIGQDDSEYKRYYQQQQDKISNDFRARSAANADESLAMRKKALQDKVVADKHTIFNRIATIVSTPVYGRESSDYKEAMAGLPTETHIGPTDYNNNDPYGEQKFVNLTSKLPGGVVTEPETGLKQKILYDPKSEQGIVTYFEKDPITNLLVAVKKPPVRIKGRQEFENFIKTYELQFKQREPVDSKENIDLLTE